MISAGVFQGAPWTEALLQVAVDQSFNAVMVTSASLDGEGPLIEYCNAALCQMTGYAAEELIGRSPRMLQGPLTDPAVLQRLRLCLAQGAHFQGCTFNYRKNGEPYHLEWTISPVVDGAGTIRHFVSVQRDMSAQVVAAHEMQLLVRALNVADDAILITDKHLVIVFVNEAFESLTGYTAAELKGQTTELLRSGEHEPTFYAQLHEALLQGRNFRATFTNRHKNGSLYYAEQSITPLRDAAGGITHYVGVSKDVTNAVQREMALREQANRDKLSGLLNRHAGEAELKRCQANALAHRQPYGLILCDIDWFKRVNDQFGHAAGDRVIKAVAGVLVDKVRSYDQVVRWGGEEFLVILANVGLNDVQESAERIRSAVAACHDAEVGAFTMSLGVGIWQSEETEDQVLHRTDCALYQAKMRGRNQVALATGPGLPDALPGGGKNDSPHAQDGVARRFNP